MAGEAPGPPPLEPLMVDPLEARLHRRGFLMLTGLACYAALGEAREQWARHTWPDEQAAIARVRDCYERRREREAELLPPRWLAWGGLGRQRNLDQAEILAHDLLAVPTAPAMAGGLNHPNQGIFYADNANLMSRYTHGTEGIKVLCHSMGFLTFMNSLLAMEHPPHVDELITVSSPVELEDVVRKGEVKLVVESGARGDIINKFFFSLLTDNDSVRSRPLDQAVDVILRGMRNARTGVSPMVYVDQLQIVYSSRIKQNLGRFRGIFTPRTRVTSLVTSHDGTLHYRRAGNGLREVFTDPILNTQFREIPFAGRHADTRAALAEAGQRRRFREYA